MHWIENLDNELGPRLSDAGRRVFGADCRCELDLLNGGFRGVVMERPTADQGLAIKRAILEVARALRPTMHDCDVYIRQPQRTPYTPHLAAFPQGVRPFKTASYFTTFDLRLSQLVEFRNAEARLAERAERAARVLGFALGGISTISRLSMAEWKALAERPMSEGATAADLTRERYHLFPGLNWRLPGTKEAFIHWVATLDVGKILIVDTGTEGHGLREIFNLLRRGLRECETSTELEFDIVGLVDGDNPDSVSDHDMGQSRNGKRFLLSLEYIKLAKVLSEDFQRFVGYRAFRSLGYVHPIRDSGLIRLVDDGGQVLQITATDNLSEVVRGYMTNAMGGAGSPDRQGRDVLSRDVERAMAAKVLEYTKSGESVQLHQAWAIGLVSDREFDALLTDIDRRYDEELLAYPLHVWCFDKKKVRERTNSDAELWSEG
ncbi:MAG TPA: hypothetical protein VG055_29910 [Planctomycetaceae bacterium]|jgi:hypothetical protein|nr:hypothetical protein [Planctomycetaceae bacterium]